MQNSNNDLALIEINTFEDFNKTVAKLENQTICLIPKGNFIRTDNKIGFVTIKVDSIIPNGQKGNKDIFKVDKGYALHLDIKGEIAREAGFKVVGHKVVERERDLVTKRIDSIKHEVSWEFRFLNSNKISGSTTGDYDYYEDIQNFLGTDGKPTYKAEKRRKSAGSLAESNAVSRAIDQALSGILPKTFTLDQLKKPFCIPYLIETNNVDSRKTEKEIENAEFEVLPNSGGNNKQQIINHRLAEIKKMKQEERTQEFNTLLKKMKRPQKKDFHNLSIEKQIANFKYLLDLEE